jgi:hypothetical protein
MHFFSPPPLKKGEGVFVCYSFYILRTTEYLTPPAKPMPCIKVQSEAYAFQPQHIKYQVIDWVTRGLMSLPGEFWIFLLSKQWSADEILREMGRQSRIPVWQEHRKEV